MNYNIKITQLGPIWTLESNGITWALSAHRPPQASKPSHPNARSGVFQVDVAADFDASYSILFLGFIEYMSINIMSKTDTAIVRPRSGCQ